jgi:hypothetical protein
MRTGTPDLLPIFRSEFQVRLLGLLILQPDQPWTIPEMAERLDAPISSVHRELRRAERAEIVDRDSDSRPHTFRGAKESPLYKPLADLLELTLGVEGEVTPAPDEIPDVEPARGPLGDLVSRFPLTLHPPICQRVIGGIARRSLTIRLLRRAWRLAGLGAESTSSERVS